MSKYQPLKKVDRRCLNFLKEQKNQKKDDQNCLDLNTILEKKVNDFQNQNRLKIRLHISEAVPLQPAEARA